MDNMVREGNPNEGLDTSEFILTPIPPKYPADYLLNNIERRIVSDESEAGEYMETFYRALVDNGLSWPMLDFQDLMTSFHSSGELVVLPTIEGACAEDLERGLKESLFEEHVGKSDIVLLTLFTPMQNEFFDEQSDLGFRNRIVDVIGEGIKLFTASFSSEKREASPLLYIGLMVIHQKRSL